MGRGGLYFRHSLGTSSPTPAPPPIPSTKPNDTAGPLENIESGPVLKMVDGSSGELLRELNEKRKRVRFLPVAAASCALALLIAANAGASGGLLAGLAPLCIGCCWIASMQDALRKTTVVFYDLEPEAECAYQALHDSFDQLRSCGRVWRVEARGDVRNRKYHAGAGAVVRRERVALSKGREAPFLKTNVDSR